MRRFCLLSCPILLLIILLAAASVGGAFAFTVRVVPLHCIDYAPGTARSSHAGASFIVARTSVVAFAGFGGSTSSSSSKKKKKGGAKNKKGKSPTVSSDNNSHNLQSLLFDTAEGRMEHIRSSLKAADLSPMAAKKQPASGGSNTATENTDSMDPNAICVLDNFLGPALISAMRREAESLVPTMVPSMSTKWDESTQSVVAYEKKGVLSTQIEGADNYEASPRLVEYVVTLTAQLSLQLNAMLPDAYQLSGTQQTNKLAVCLGDGSMYDKHIDNLGGGNGNNNNKEQDSVAVGDQRKLTALLYLQPPGSHDGQPDYPHETPDHDPRGGYFRAYDVPTQGETTCVAPRGDRLILFWSDSLVHDVSPSFAPNGDADRRWALTVWFVVGPSGTIRATDAAVEERHFGTG